MVFNSRSHCLSELVVPACVMVSDTPATICDIRWRVYVYHYITHHPLLCPRRGVPIFSDWSLASRYVYINTSESAFTFFHSLSIYICTKRCACYLVCRSACRDEKLIMEMLAFSLSYQYLLNISNYATGASHPFPNPKYSPFFDHWVFYFWS